MTDEPAYDDDELEHATALAEALASLASDADERARLGARGAAVARELFDPSEVVRAYERLYLSLAGN